MYRGGGMQGMHGGGMPQRGAGSFSGMAFSESELMSELPKKKFTGRCRLFVGNLPNEVKEAELKELFAPHGDIAECYLSGKGFAFLRMVNAWFSVWNFFAFAHSARASSLTVSSLLYLPS